MQWLRPEDHGPFAERLVGLADGSEALAAAIACIVDVLMAAPPSPEGRLADAHPWAMLPSRPGLDADIAAGLCRRWVLDLSTALETRGASATLRRAVLSCAVARLQTLCRRRGAPLHWRRMLALGHNRLGALHAAEGRDAHALAAYRRGLVANMQVSERDPGDAVARQDQAVGLVRLAELLQKSGERTPALEALRRAEALARGLLAEDPLDPPRRHLLLAALAALGDLSLARGDVDAASRACAEGLAQAESLLREDPLDPARQHDLLASLCAMAEVRLAEGQAPLAQALAQRAMPLADALVACQPANPRTRLDAALCRILLGDALMAQGQAPAALDVFREGLATRAATEGVTVEAGMGPGRQFVRARLLDALLARQDARAALAASTELLRASRALVSASPGRGDALAGLWLSLGKHARALQAAGDREGALAAQQEALAIAQRQAQCLPRDERWQRQWQASRQAVWAAYRPNPSTGPSTRPSTYPPIDDRPPVGRNQPCPCGSGRRYKLCHGRLD